MGEPAGTILTPEQGAELFAATGWRPVPLASTGAGVGAAGAQVAERARRAGFVVLEAV